MSEIHYLLNAPVPNAALNALFAQSWPGPHTDWDFAPTHARSMGYVCAFDGDDLVGYVNLAWDGGVHTFLLDPTVRPDYQRRGIGRALVRHAEELARQNGAEWLHVDFDPELESFYRGCGFVATLAGLINLTVLSDRS